MDKSEVICISSDDDNQSPQKIRGQPTDINEQKKAYPVDVKVEKSLKHGDRKETVCKRRKSTEEEATTSNGSKKKSKPNLNTRSNDVAINDTNDITCKAKNELKDELQDNKIMLKPTLIIKEKKSIVEAEDPFIMFTNFCLQRENTAEMATIINRLKVRYSRLEQSYVHSEAFVEFIKQVTDSITNGGLLYMHIKSVMDEFKYKLNGQTKSNNNIQTQKDEEKDEDKDEDELGSLDKQLECITKAMEKCHRRINDLEEAETDLDDDYNSNYIKLERYKQRIVKLHNKYCELSGERNNMEQQHLVPKNITKTQIPALDQVITDFINSKISRRCRSKKMYSFASVSIFPDYRDILKCVQKCNKLHNLDLKDNKQRKIAKTAFLQLGEYLQRHRRNEYREGFLFLLTNKEEDPALTDSALKEKLIANSREGQKKLTRIFQEYVGKQEEMTEEASDNKSTSENENNSDGSEDEEKDPDEDTNDISLSIDDEIFSADEASSTAEEDKATRNEKIPTVHDTQNADENESKIEPKDVDKLELANSPTIVDLERVTRNGESSTREIGTVSSDVITESAETPSSVILDLVPSAESEVVVPTNESKEATNDAQFEEGKSLLVVAKLIM